MDTNFAAVTIFTLLFAVCAARISLDTQPHCKVDESNLGFVPRDTNKPGFDEPENVLESGKDRTARVDLTPRSDFARFHAINSRFFDQSRVPIRSVHTRTHQHFQHPIVTPSSKISDGKGVMLNHEIGNVQANSFHQATRLKFKHDHHHHHHHHEQDHHFRHINKDNNVVYMPKHKFVREKVVHQHKVETEREIRAETKEQEPSFMKSIRKFLKHSTL